MPRYDRVIKNGMIVDGSRCPRFRGDIGVRDGRIAEIGQIDASSADEVLDAQGLIVAPGFIDLHTHYDAQLFWDPYLTLSSWHGITSVVIGNCGFGFAPVRPVERERAMLSMTRVEAIPLPSMKTGMPWDWVTFPEFMGAAERRGGTPIPVGHASDRWRKRPLLGLAERQDAGLDVVLGGEAAGERALIRAVAPRPSLCPALRVRPLRARVHRRGRRRVSLQLL